LKAGDEHSGETYNNSKTAKEKTMIKNIWKPLQITWLVVAMFTAQTSIQALKSEANYCSGMARILCVIIRPNPKADRK
jgi:hypothetical protein